MSVRHAVLSIGAAMVLGLGVYLFVEVRAQPSPMVSSDPGTARERAAAPAPPAIAGPPATRPVAAAPPPAPPPTPAPVAPPAPPETPAPALATGDPPAAPAASDAAEVRLDAAMAEANKAYDRGDLDDAKTIAARLLARQPDNVRMLRIMVSASCIDGDSAMAQASFARLPPPDQAQMRVRCARYGIAFPDKP